MLQEIADTLSAPRRWLWGMLPGLHDDAGNALSGSQLAQNAFGMDPESPWTKALGFGLEAAGDPMNLLIPMAGRALSAGTGLKYAAPAAEAADAATNAFNPAVRGLRNTFGMVKRFGSIPEDVMPAALDMAEAGTMPRRAVTMFSHDGPSMIGEKAGPLSGLTGDFLQANTPDVLSGRIGGSFAPISGNSSGITGVGVSTNPIANRHEVVHGLINAAAETGNTAGLPLSMRLPANLYRYGGERGVTGALGGVLDEAAAHAAEGRGFLDQFGRYGDFLLNPHPDYLTQTAAKSPLIAAMHRNFKYAAPATLAGGAYLGAKPFFGGQ